MIESITKESCKAQESVLKSESQCKYLNSVYTKLANKVNEDHKETITRIVRLETDSRQHSNDIAILKTKIPIPEPEFTDDYHIKRLENQIQELKYSLPSKKLYP